MWVAVTLLMTAAIGFVAGVCYARASVKWTYRRARKPLSRLFSSVIGALETAQETCAFLEKFPNLLLTTEQIEKLDTTRSRLLETVTAVVDTQRYAESIRQAVRHYRFRIDASGPEVLVTASFGYTTCLPDDNHDLPLDRAGNALAKSERRGRNQLHVHDGNTLANCVVN